MAKCELSSLNNAEHLHHRRLDRQRTGPEAYRYDINSTDVQILTRHGDDIARALARGVTDYGQGI